MTKPAGGLRDRRPDVMELLARARPASLDPGQNPQAQAAEIARLTAVGAAAASATAAGTVATGTVAAGAATAGRAEAAAEPAPLRPGRRLPRAAVLAGTGLTAVAAAVAVIVLVTSAGGTGTAPGGRTRSPVLLTAAMIHQVASASRSALARSGRATISNASTQNGVPGTTSTDVITFSGKNWNDVISQTSPGSGGRPGHTQTAINRIVNGQLYLYIAARTRRLQWYHDTNSSGHPSVSIPDPRTVLRALAPSARFEVVGHQVIGGVRVKELRATDLNHLPGQGKLVGAFAAGGHVTSLEVWVDGHGVVRRLSLTSEQINKRWSVSAYNVRHRGHGPLIFTVPNQSMAAHLKATLKQGHGAPRVIIRIARHPAAPRREVQVNRLTVTFSAIGQRQRITAPAHPIPVYGRG